MDIKKFLMILVLLTGLTWLHSCGGDNDTANVKSPERNRVEVIYFHGKQRCSSCAAIEKNTREVVNTMFADELKNGSLVFKIVNIATTQGEKMADEYQVTWSSLFVNKWKEGKETRNDMTKFGFDNARRNPEVFKKGLADKIRESLK